MIQLINVSKSFKANGVETDAVKDVSLEINDGEIFGIIGYSGAGKSTLVRCINMLEKPTKGKVIVNGIEMTSLPEKKLRTQRRNIGMIFQNFNLMPSRTAAQNIAYPLQFRGLDKSEIEKKTASLLELTGLSDKASAYPSELSGGQKQRVAIARALATDPKILLCDEATSALDPQTTESILELLKSLNKKLKITIVIITHQMLVIKEICSRAAIMEKGRIIEEGDVFSIFSSPKTDLARQFIESTSTLSKIETFIKEDSPLTRIKQGQKILRLRYSEKTTCDALITGTARKFNIDLNIILGDIEIINGAPLGGTVCIAEGTEKNIEDAIEYIKSLKVKVEVLK